MANKEITKRKLVLYFIVDTSGSMSGDRINTVNKTVTEVLPKLREISSKNKEVQIEIAVLEFESNVSWMYSNPIVVDNFSWKTLTANGGTSYYKALNELSSKLTTSGFMQNDYLPPVFILFSDGDGGSYTSELNKLRENNWFKSGIKIAIAIGSGVNMQMLYDFTGGQEAVFTVHDMEALKKIILGSTVTSSLVASSTAPASDSSRQKSVVENLKKVESGELSIDNISTIDELESKSEFKPLTDKDVQHKIMSININRSFGTTSLYEATRGCWKVNAQRIKEIDLVFSEYKGVIRAIFKPSKWMPDQDRWKFKGQEVTDKVIEDLYLNKLLPKRKKGSANPIRYFYPGAKIDSDDE